MISLRMLILFAVANLLVNLYIALFDIHVIFTVSVFSTVPVNFVDSPNFRVPHGGTIQIGGTLIFFLPDFVSPNEKSASAHEHTYMHAQVPYTENTMYQLIICNTTSIGLMVAWLSKHMKAVYR